MTTASDYLEANDARRRAWMDARLSVPFAPPPASAPAAAAKPVRVFPVAAPKPPARPFLKSRRRA